MRGGRVAKGWVGLDAQYDTVTVYAGQAVDGNACEGCLHVCVLVVRACVNSSQTVSELCSDQAERHSTGA